MGKTIVKKMTGNRICLVLAFIMTMSVLIFASALDTYAADNEPKDLRWNEFRPYRAEWEWTADDEYPDKVDITEQYDSLDGDESKTRTFEYNDCNYTTRDGVSFIDFNDSSDDYFFRTNGEGYYSFYLDVYYSGQSEPERISCGRVHYCSVAYEEVILGADGNPYDRPGQVDRDIRLSVDQEADDHYYIFSNNTMVLPADKTIKAKVYGVQTGFAVAGFDFEPVPSDLIVSESNEKVSFTLDKNTKMTVRIMQDLRTVPVTIEFGEWHDEVAAATAEKIRNPRYSSDPSYEATVSGSTVTITNWPQATKMGDLKTLISDRIHDAWPEPGYHEVFHNSEYFDGKIGTKSISEYSDEQEYLEEIRSDETTDIPDGELTLYILWDKLISEASYIVEPPVCGTEITLVSDRKQSPSPVVKPAEGCHVDVNQETGPLWYKGGSVFTGTIKGEETYSVMFGIKSAFGYHFGSAPGVTPVLKINGTEVPDYSGSVFNYYSMQAVHDPESDWTVKTPPTCLTAGIRELRCAGCGKVLETETMEALGHDWELKETASTGSRTVEYYECRRCTEKLEIEIEEGHKHGVGSIAFSEEVQPTCTETGKIFYYLCGCGARFRDEEEQDQLWTRPLSDDEIIIPALGHNWGDWIITKEPTETEEGIKTHECARCHETETQSIPAKGSKPTPSPSPSPSPSPAPAPGSDPNQKGRDGTPAGAGASAACVDKAITSSTSEEGPEGTKFAPLALKSRKQGKNSITLSWNSAKGAVKYVIYGNACGRKNRMKRIAETTYKTLNVKNIDKKLKKGTYHKFIVVALDSSNNVVSTSKVIHVATKGGKVKNPTKVTVKSSVVRKVKSLKNGKSIRLNARQAGSKVRKHRAISYESTDPEIAAVSKKGVVKGRKKGTCYVYAYAQNGVYNKIKIVVS